MNTHKEPKFKVGDRVTDNDWNRVGTIVGFEPCSHPCYRVEIEDDEHLPQSDMLWFMEHELTLAPLEPKEEPTSYKCENCGRVAPDWQSYEDAGMTWCSDCYGKTEPTPPSQIEEESEYERGYRDGFKHGAVNELARLSSEFTAERLTPFIYNYQVKRYRSLMPPERAEQNIEAINKLTKEK